MATAISAAEKTKIDHLEEQLKEQKKQEEKKFQNEAASADPSAAAP